MAKLTKLGYAILGLLAAGPKSGYDIAQVLRKPVSFFWSANHSQIFPELARLQAGGFVTYEVVEQYDRPDKKLYSITPGGLEAVKQWLVEPIEPQTVRDELVLRAFFVWLADPAQAAALFREQERLHKDQLAEHQQSLASYEGAGVDREDLSSPDFANYLTLLRGIGYEREYAAWCGLVAKKIEQAAGHS